MIAVLVAAAVAVCPIALDAFIDLAKSRPTYANHHVLTGEGIALGAEVFNSMPPASDDDWTLVVIIDLADGSGVLAVGRDDRVCHSPQIPERDYQALKRGLWGTDV